jgi:hypothetical protein
MVKLDFGIGYGTSKIDRNQSEALINSKFELISSLMGLIKKEYD